MQDNGQLNLQESWKHRVYPITRRIAIGQYATRDRCDYLRQIGVTHILNVGEAPSVLTAQDVDLCQVLDNPIVDFNRIPDDHATRCLDILHGMLRVSNSLVYVHCIACQNRSPTIVWLYLVACGVEPSEAKKLIVDRCPDAVPGHSSLVDHDLIAAIQNYGKEFFRPLLLPQTIEPV